MGIHEETEKLIAEHLGSYDIAHPLGDARYRLQCALRELIEDFSFCHFCGDRLDNCSVCDDHEEDE